MAQTRAVIDIVRAKAGAHQLLEEISFLVRPLGRPETGKRLCSLTLADGCKAAGGRIKRLLPARLAEMRPRIGRIDLIIGMLGHPRQTDQRLGQAMGMLDIIIAEAPLDAQAVAIGRACPALGCDDCLILHLISDLTANPAIGTE